jgi:hypothetical protein
MGPSVGIQIGACLRRPLAAGVWTLLVAARP